MRILALTAGASRMYCGTCLRDNALAAELIRQRHDVVLLPLYTATRTDESNVSHHQVFFNGISLYLRQRFPWLSALPAFLHRLLNLPWLLRFATSRSVPVDPKLLGELTVAMLEGREGNLRREFDQLLEWLKTQPSFDVVDLPHSLLIGLARPLKAALGCPVACTLQGEDLFLEGLQEPYRSRALTLIRECARHVDGFIVSSRYYADFMSGYLSIPPEKIYRVPLAINLKGHAPAPAEDGTFRIGYMARVAPEKGLHLLVDAYCKLRQEAKSGPARLEVAGYMDPAQRSYLHQLERLMRKKGLAEEFVYHGELDRPAKIRFLQRLDVLSVPSTFDEPKGLFVLEALANGVPVVQPRRGIFPEIVGSTRGGLLVEPDNPNALALALRRLWQDEELRRLLGRQGHEAVGKYHGIERLAEETLKAYRGLVADADY